MIKAFIAIAMLTVLLATPAHANCEPWIAHSQSVIAPAGGYTDNPAPRNLGLVGTVTSLPYTVPAGKKLIIKYIALEGIWGHAIWPWIGDPPFTAAKALSTFVAPTVKGGSGTYSGTRQWTPTYVIPAGSKFNITQQVFDQPSPGSWVYGWEVSGELCDD